MENEKIMEEYENEDGSDSSETLVSEETEGDTEVSETLEPDNETGTDGETLETVSDGDSAYVDYCEQLDDVINELIYQREQMDSLQAYLESKDMTIFDKPLEKYTVTEGLLLLSFFVIAFMALMKLIGGILTCKV